MLIFYYFFILIALLYFFKHISFSFREGILIGLIFVTFALNSLPWNILPSGMSVVFNLVFLFLAFIQNLFINKERALQNYKINEHIVYTFIFLGLLIFYIPFSEAQQYGIVKTSLFFLNNLLPILALLCFSPFTNRDYKIIYFTIIAGAFLSLFKIFSSVDLNTDRIEESPIILAENVGLGACLIWVSFLHNNNNAIFNRKIFYGILFSVFLIGMFLTGSRGPILTLLFLMIFSVLMYSNNKKRIMALILKIGIIISSIIVISRFFSINFMSFPSVNRILNSISIFSQGGAAEVDETRSNLLLLAWEGFKKSNGLGIGTGGFANLYGREGTYPHNVFFEIGVELGIVGLLLFFIILIRNIIRMKRKLSSTNLVNSYQAPLYSLWLFILGGAMVSGDISMNIFWVAMIFIWLPVLEEKQ